MTTTIATTGPSGAFLAREGDVGVFSHGGGIVWVRVAPDGSPVPPGPDPPQDTFLQARLLWTLIQADRAQMAIQAGRVVGRA